MRLLRNAVLGTALLLAACAAPTPRAPAGDVAVERVDKAFDIAPGITRVAIDNPYGEINLRSRDEREVGIHAVVQRLSPRARFDLHHTGRVR